LYELIVGEDSGNAQVAEQVPSQYTYGADDEVHGVRHLYGNRGADPVSPRTYKGKSQEE